LVTLRFSRTGRSKKPSFRLFAIDKADKRDGRALEELGYYNPTENPPKITVKEEQTIAWLNKGAEPSETVESVLKQVGVWQKWLAQKPAPAAAKK
jgi:small subunit ribosomal protein S16